MFLAENQSVVLYAVDIGLMSPDPPVVMANNAETFEWYEVCRRCSEFLQVMLYWEGAFGGAMSATGSGIVDAKFREVLEREFRPVGEVNEMWAYAKPGVAVCFVRWDDGWRIFVGATSDALLAEFERDLEVELEQ